MERWKLETIKWYGIAIVTHVGNVSVHLFSSFLPRLIPVYWTSFKSCTVPAYFMRELSK